MGDQSQALAELLPEIQAAARHVAAEWADVVEAGDLENDIALKLLEERQAANLLAYEPHARRKTLFKIGVQLASGERDDLEYFHGNYRYSTDEVRRRLQAGSLLGVETADGPEDADVRLAVTQLTCKQKNAVIGRYVNLETPTSDTGRKALQLGVDALTHHMNRIHRQRRFGHEGPGSRRVASSSWARTQAGVDWQGDAGNEFGRR